MGCLGWRMGRGVGEGFSGEADGIDLVAFWGRMESGFLGDCVGGQRP